VEISLTAAWKDAPLLGCDPVACHSIKHMRARSGGDANNLILQDLGLASFRLGEIPVSDGTSLPRGQVDGASRRELGLNPCCTK
jgi:hypothetical protein